MAQPRRAVPWIRPGPRDDRSAAKVALSESTLAIYAITIAFSAVGCVLGLLYIAIFSASFASNGNSEYLDSPVIALIALFTAVVFATLFAAATGTFAVGFAWVARETGLSPYARGVSAGLGIFTGFVVVLAYLWTQSVLLPAVFVAVYGLAAAIWVAVVVRYHARGDMRTRAAGSDLRSSDLHGDDLRSANLRRADLHRGRDAFGAVPRFLSDPEKGLLRALVAQAGVASRGVGSIDSIRVVDMNDGGMGSIRTADRYDERSFGGEVAEIAFNDADGMFVSAALNVDADGEFYEIDIFTGDGSPLIRLPEFDA